MEAAVDVCSAFPAEKVLWYRYRLVISGAIGIGHVQSLGIIAVRAGLVVCDAVPGLCIDSAIRHVRVDLLGVIRIVFVEAIRELRLGWNLSMEVSVQFFALKDVGTLVVRSRIER